MSLRGVPFIGHGGAIRGTDPVQALLAKERRQQRVLLPLRVKRIIAEPLPLTEFPKSGGITAAKRRRWKRFTAPDGRFF